ncbi:hypothetical protein LTR66_017660, partial [Elasticomyces elasticus]
MQGGQQNNAMPWMGQQMPQPMPMPMLHYPAPQPRMYPYIPSGMQAITLPPAPPHNHASQSAQPTPTQTPFPPPNTPMLTGSHAAAGNIAQQSDPNTSAINQYRFNEYGAVLCSTCRKPRSARFQWHFHKHKGKLENPNICRTCREIGTSDEDESRDERSGKQKRSGSRHRSRGRTVMPGGRATSVSRRGQ